MSATLEKKSGKKAGNGRGRRPAPVPAYQLYINGTWTPPSDGGTLPVLNPGTQEIIATVPRGSAKDVDRAVRAAREAFDHGPWPRTTPAERQAVLLKIADLTEQRIADLAALESKNQGKTIKQARDGDFPFGVDNIRFFAGAIRALEGKASMDYMGTATSILRREPVGVVASITPWNYPWMMAVWKIIPAIAAGNTVVCKPASETPLTTLEWMHILQDAGLPPGVVNVVTGLGSEIGDALVGHPGVDMVSLTGSTRTGKRIAQVAADSLKKVHLELGGKAPFIVFADADLEAAAEGAVVAGFVNGGQDCTQACRFYVQESVYEKFLKKIVEKARTIRIGNQLEETTDLGPLVSAAHLEKVEQYVKLGKKEGARLVLGGGRPAKESLKNGFYFEPTIFADGAQSMKIVQEEIFGPVLVVSKFKSLDEAVRKANDTPYGLYASVWTKDLRQAFLTANQLRFGAVGINDHLPLTSEMPHGGYKQSGNGKDLSLYALEEYTQVKHIFVDLSGVARKGWHYLTYGSPNG